RHFEPFTPESIARYEARAADGSATGLLMLDVAKLPESEQDAAQEKLLADGLLRMDYDENGEEIGTKATKKAVDIFVCEGKLKYVKNKEGVRGTQRIPSNGCWVAVDDGG